VGLLDPTNLPVAGLKQAHELLRLAHGLEEVSEKL
jgi:hypothetical protein